MKKKKTSGVSIGAEVAHPQTVEDTTAIGVTAENVNERSPTKVTATIAGRENTHVDMISTEATTGAIVDIAEAPQKRADID